MKKSSNKGFTLVELIIVIAILAIIMLIAIPNFSGIQQRMQVRADKQTAAQIGKAIRIWYAERVSDGLDVSSLYNLGVTTDGLKLNGKVYSGSAEKASTDGLVPYSELTDIDEYISKTNYPSSLSDDNGAKVDRQMYAPVLVGQDRTSKIMILIVRSANNTDTSLNSSGSDAQSATIKTTWWPANETTLASLSASYSGEGAGIAYIEP